MKILYGITKSNFGGAQKYVFDLALEAKNNNHEVSVLCGGDGLLVKKLLENKIRVISLPSLSRDVNLISDFLTFISIFKLLRKERPDVFHLNSSKMGVMGALAGRLAGLKKIIFTAHGWAFNEVRHWIEQIIIEEIAWITILLSDKTICVSERIKSDVDSKPMTSKKLVVIKNGADIFDLLSKEDARKALVPELPQDSLLVGTLSELHHTKGIDIALRAINKMETKVHFVVMGSGEASNKLRKLTKTLGISERVHFLGFLENAKEYLKALDIFTLTSRTEGLPYVLLEAGLASLPVVATNVGGIPEIVKDNQTGILVPKEDYKTLSKLLDKLINSPETQKKLGESLNKKILKNFSKEKMVRETLNLYY
ncbi:MAG: glycosyltransferase family 4 protein [Minisyncoccota bacterium]